MKKAKTPSSAGQPKQRSIASFFAVQAKPVVVASGDPPVKPGTAAGALRFWRTRSAM